MKEISIKKSFPYSFSYQQYWTVIRFCEIFDFEFFLSAIVHVIIVINVIIVKCGVMTSLSTLCCSIISVQMPP